MEYEEEIANKIKADFTLIVRTFPKGTSMLFIKPYVSGTVINVSEFMSEKYGKSYEYFLKIVEPIAERLMKEYF